MPKIELYPHNQAALNHLEEALKYTRPCCGYPAYWNWEEFCCAGFYRTPAE